MLDLRSFTWTFGDSCTIVHDISSEAPNAFSNVHNRHFRRSQNFSLKIEGGKRSIPKELIMNSNNNKADHSLVGNATTDDLLRSLCLSVPVPVYRVIKTVHAS